MQVPSRREPPTGQQEHHGRRRGGWSSQEESGSEDLPDYRRPRDESAPELPNDLTDLDDVDLMELLTKLTQWHNFAARKLSEAEVASRRAEVALSEAKATAMVKAWGGTKEDRVRASEAQRDSSPEVHAANEEALNTYALRKRLEVRTQAFADDAFVVSRELTRRTKMEPSNRRESRWGGS